VIELSCHCGAVRFAVETAPPDVTDCNCSICRRYGTLWAYYQRPDVRFEADNGPTDTYVWRYRMLEFHRCHACGCVTHWAAVDPAFERMGLNARLMSPEVLAQIPVRHFDGAST
jgi:hypothetical protein